MYVSRSETAVVGPPQGVDADRLRGDFKAFCADKQKLERWFRAEVEFIPTGRRGSVAGMPNLDEKRK